MRTLAKTIPVLIVAAVSFIVWGVPNKCFSAETKAPCQWEQTADFTFRIHPFSYGADTDIKVKYSASLHRDGVVWLKMLSIDADPWSYARLQSKIVPKTFDAEHVYVENHTEVSFNLVTQEALYGELIPVYGPTYDIGITKREVPGFYWDPACCPKIRSVQESPPLMFTGNNLSGPSYAKRVIDVKGDVKIQHEGSGQIEKPSPGMEVKAGDKIETKEGEITFFTVASKVKLGAHTIVNVSYDKLVPSQVKSLLSMVKGVLWARAKKDDRWSLKVSVPNAVCGVRGTSYKLTYDQATNTTVVEVEDGVVSLSDPQERKTVEVKAGMKSSIKGNGLPSDPVPVR